MCALSMENHEGDSKIRGLEAMKQVPGVDISKIDLVIGTFYIDGWSEESLIVVEEA